MADCLTLLRQYNLQKKEIVERDELIIFDQIAWSRNAKTNYLTYRFTVYQWSREVASPRCVLRPQVWPGREPQGVLHSRVPPVPPEECQPLPPQLRGQGRGESQLLDSLKV